MSKQRLPPPPAQNTPPAVTRHRRVRVLPSLLAKPPEVDIYRTETEQRLVADIAAKPAHWQPHRRKK